MTLADLIISQPVVSALGWTLVHFLWQGCVIAALFWLVCVLSRRESAHLRYWSGISGFVLSLASLIITFIIYYQPEARFSFGSIAAESVNPFLVLSGTVPNSWPLLQEGIEPALPVIVLLWMLGVLYQSTRMVCGWIGVKRLVGSADSDIGSELLESVSKLTRTLGVSRPVRVLKSGLVNVPMAVGWLRPVILLPASVLISLPKDQLEMIVAHELGHIRRQDYLLNLLQIVFETLLFYHPAISWMSGRIREERENCCDDLVVSQCRKPATYARALANLEVIRNPMEVAAMTATGGDLFGRIKRIIDTELPRSNSGYAQVSLLAVVAFVVALGAQQGMLLSQALNKVAGSVSLQTSDVEWTTWGDSREAWAAGVKGYSLNIDNTDSKNPLQDILVVSIDAGMTPEIFMTAPRDSQLEAEKLREEPVFAEMIVNTRRNPSGIRLLSIPMPSSVSAQPAPIKTAAPRYPWRARSKGVEGFVQLSFDVDNRGRVANIEIVDSMPSGTFDRAALKALKKWRFEARSAEEKPQKFIQIFDFNLDEQIEFVQNRRDCARTGRRTCSRFPSKAIVVYVNPPSTRTKPL